MELKYVQEFVTLTEYMNFSNAAEEMFMSQSTLSKHIRTLEGELGGTLFNRTTRSIALTELGYAFLPYARTLSQTAVDCEAAVHEYQHRQEGLFTIAVVHHLQWYNVTQYFINFHKQYPDSRINVIESDERGITELFQSRRVNLMTVAIPDDQIPEFEFIPVAKSSIVVMLPKGHVLERKDKITLRELTAYDLILPDRDSSLYDMIDRAFRDHDIVPKVVYTGSSIGCVDLIKAKMGVSLQSSEHITGTLDEGVCYRELTQPLTYRYGLGYRQGPGLTEMECAFIDYMRTLSI